MKRATRTSVCQPWSRWMSARARVVRRLISLLSTSAIICFIAGFPVSPVSYAATATPTAVISCNPCSQLSDLNAAASNWFSQQGWPHGAIVLVTSLNAPISAFVKNVCSPKTGGCFNKDITPDNPSAAALDNGIFARAAKLPPVNLPGNSYDDVPEIIVAAIQSVLVANGQTGLNVWHGFLNFPQVQWYNLVDTQTGQTYQVYVGDTITVKFANGYSQQFQFLGVLSGGSIQWKAVPNTLMKDGKPVQQPSSSPATPISGAGSLDGFGSYNGGDLNLNLDIQFCYGVSIGCIAYENEELCSNGTFTFPC